LKIIKDRNYMYLVENILNRNEDNYKRVDWEVDRIIDTVKKSGDRALYEYTESFDGCSLDRLKVSEGEIEDALSRVGDSYLSILKEAYQNIYGYHENQRERSWFVEDSRGAILGQIVNPISRIGIYVPGGKAAYPSTVLMNSIPATIAGVSSIAMVTPPDKNGNINPYILAAAHICNIDEIYKVGGAQSIAALAFGTETIAPVYKIVGPGNIYVARAKRAVFGRVDIDMMAGPSEICIVADEGSNPKYIAADLLSQAEHDEMASCILITTSERVAKEVLKEIEIQKESLDRRNIIVEAISNNGYIFIVKDIKEGIEVANRIAPEHLELMVDNPFKYLTYINNAGAIFMGSYSPEPLGDYFAGPNHVLPTNGSSRYSSSLGVYDFVKKSSLIYYNERAFRDVKDKIIRLAELEGLDAHANSVRVRFK